MIVIVFYLVLSSSFSFCDSKEFSAPPIKLLDLLKWEVTQHVKPATVWFLDARDPYKNTTGKNETHSTSADTFLKDLNKADIGVPIIIGNFGKSFRANHHHLTSFIFIVLIPIPSDQEILNDTNLGDQLETFGNKRKDRFIFVGKEKSLKPLFRDSSVVNKLRNKVGYALDSVTILIEPLNYNPKEELVRIKDISNYPIVPLMRQNIMGRHFRLTGSLLPPWLYRINENPKTGSFEFDGSNYRIFLEASRKFNFTFELNAPPGRSYGNLLPNGTWSGQVGDISNKEKNSDSAVFLGHLFIWYSLIDFAGTLDSASLLFITSYPQLVIDWEAFFHPFQSLVWILIFILYCLICFALFISLSFRKSKIELGKLSLKERIIVSLVVPYSIALEQNAMIPRKVRNLAAIWMILTIFTGMGYKSNLASYLSLPTATSIPTTNEELSIRKDYKIILNVLGAAEKSFFENNKSPTIVKLRKRMEFTPSVHECAEKAVLQEKTACFSWTPLITAFSAEVLTTNTRIDPLMYAKDVTLPATMSVAFRKDSQYVDSFTPITTSIFETGIYHLWWDEAFHYHRVIGRKNILKEKESGSKKAKKKYEILKSYEDSLGLFGSSRPFSITNLKFSFLALTGGVLLSFSTFLIEMCAKAFLRNVNNLQKGESESIRISVKPGEIDNHHHPPVIILQRDSLLDALGELQKQI